MTADLGNGHCPCHIFVNETGLQTADCRKQKLNTIPDCVPNTTQWLDFGWNDLQYSPGQFQRFENLVYLSVFRNYEFAAQIDSFKFLPSLVILNLSYTNLMYLNGDTFRDQLNLRELGIKGKFGELNVSQTLFCHLRNLERLALGDKGNMELPNWSFVTLPRLSVLDLSVTIILKLHNNTFSGLSSLTSLYLTDPWVTIDLPDEVFKPLISLEELHLVGLCGSLSPSFDCTTIDERLQHIPTLKILYIDKSLVFHLKKGFLYLKHLEELYLLNSNLATPSCSIAILKPATFANLSHSPLTKFVLNHCNIGLIWPSWFQHLTYLKEISLSVDTTDPFINFWNDFSANLKNTAVNMLRLSLKGLGIVPELWYLTVHVGFNETKLTTLELTETKFGWVYDDAITKLPQSLKHLNFTHNHIFQFGVENLKYLENLETLDLSNQVDFKEYHSSKDGHDALEFCHQTESRTQNFPIFFRKSSDNVCDINQLQAKIQTYFNVIKSKCLSLPPRLKILNLSKSRLLCNMVPAFCDSNNSLKILDASLQREKSCFETGSFWSVLKNLGNLEELNLRGNWISEIPIGAFSGLYKLRKLTLGDNKLLELSFDARDLISLKTLDLSVNSIQYASKGFTNQIEEVSWKTNLTLYLNKNPLVCDCKQIDMIAWLIVTKVISNKNELNCTFDNGTRLSLERISRAHGILKYKCTMLDITIGCTVTFWGLNLVLGGLAYIWHSRQKLRYLVSYGRRTLNPYHPTEDCDIEMEYDVYISYEGDFYVTRDMTLRDFVINKILPGLEQRGIRVMIREKLDPGRNLYEVLTQSVRRSRKVVALLTNDYCQDMWNVFEFNQAVMEGIYTNRQVAIPVLFESLRYDKVKEEICEFLQMEPVHKYSPELSDRAFIDFLYERIRETRQFG